MVKHKIIEHIQSKSPTLSINIIDCDLLKLEDQISQIDKSGVELIHFDIKDGCFVPYLTFGPCFVKAVKTTLLKDVHLMIHDPAEKYQDYIESGADIITLHIESDYNLHETLKDFDNYKNINDPERTIIRGIAMNPDIPVEDLAPFLEDVEMVTVMGYNPKFKNGKIDDRLSERVKKIKKMIDYTKKDILLSINGGIDINNIKEFAGLGADILVTGKSVFNDHNLLQNIEKLLALIK